MEELIELREKLSAMRDQLHKLISEKNNFLDPEVLAASKKMDTMLNEYEQLIILKNRLY